MAKRKHTMTDRALARMLVEPVAHSILDSGGTNGRAYQRNRAMGLTVDTLIERPDVSVSAYDNGDGYVTLDLFHYLRSKVEYRHDITIGLQSFGRSSQRGSDSWYQTVDEFVAFRVTSDPDASLSEVKRTIADQGHEYCDYVTGNTYNDENLLSQDFCYAIWWDERTCTRLVSIMIHGGADARGGYTAPKIFELTTDEPWDFMDWASYSVVCTKLGNEDQILEARMAESVAWQRLAQRERAEMLPGMPLTPAPSWDTEPWADVHCWDTRGPGEWVTYGGSFVDNPWDKAGLDGEDLPRFRQGVNGSPDVALCPCGEVATLYTR